jgi:hypothetical protein
MGLPTAQTGNGTLTVHVLRCDTFGNLILDATEEQLASIGSQLGDAVAVRHAGAAHTARYVTTFAEVAPGELLIYEDATRTLALAVNRGSAAELLGVVPDDELLVRPA